MPTSHSLSTSWVYTLQGQVKTTTTFRGLNSDMNPFSSSPDEVPVGPTYAFQNESTFYLIVPHQNYTIGEKSKTNENSSLNFHPVQSLSVGGCEREPWWEMRSLLLIRPFHNSRWKGGQPINPNCGALGPWGLASTVLTAVTAGTSLPREEFQLHTSQTSLSDTLR